MSVVTMQAVLSDDRLNRATNLAVAASIGLHVAFALFLLLAEPWIRQPERVETKIEIAVRRVEPPKVEEVAPPPEPEPPAPKPEPEKPKPPKPQEVKTPVEPPPEVEPAKTAAAPNEEAPPEPTTQRKIFGVSMSSTVESGAGGMAVAVGNTVMTSPQNTAKPEDVKPLAAAPANLPLGPGGDGNGLTPAPGNLITQEPRLMTRSKPAYTEEARRRGIEGKVKLLLIIDEEGVVRSAKILQGLGFGLDEAARDFALKEMRFTPAKIGDKAVVRKIPFTINFVLD